MNKTDMFEVLQTCIIGESFRACGVGYHPEDALEPYHASERGLQSQHATKKR